MKRVLSIACLLFSFALAVSLSAQAPTAGMKIASEADYATHMKEIGQLNGVLNKSIKGAMADEASKAAERMEVLFKNVHAYWAAKKVDDATTAAQAAVTGLQATQKALTANDMAAAETARATVAAQCMACHTAHREKLPEGGFKMK
jgi:predicted mannosyl-3-phosphoglycerate phosphatase (HAD superfamily)